MIDCDLLFTADFIVTQNASRAVMSDAALAVSGAKIAAIGPRALLEKEYAPAVRRDLGKALLLPGLVNAHSHVPMTLLRGLADDLPLMEWLTEHIFPLEAKLTPHMIEAGTMLACAEMLRTGTTTCVDMYMFEVQVYGTIDQCGMKALVGEGIYKQTTTKVSNPMRAYELVREQATALRGHPRLRYAVMPHSVYTTDFEMLEKSAVLAEELELPLHIHLAETASETAQCLELYGCRPVEVCRRAGLLGSRTFIAHGVNLLDEEIELLAERGVSLAHCPRSNLKLASGIAPVPRMLQKGMNVALGTDGASSNNMLNMFMEMNAAALLHKVSCPDPIGLPAQTALNMATINGGKALFWPELGSLVSGGPADFTALDLTAPNLMPNGSPISQLVYAATGHEVFLTVVDGQILYDNGRFLSMDYPAVLQEVQDIRAWLVKN